MRDCEGRILILCECVRACEKRFTENSVPLMCTCMCTGLYYIIKIYLKVNVMHNILVIFF